MDAMEKLICQTYIPPVLHGLVDYSVSIVDSDIDISSEHSMEYLNNIEMVSQTDSLLVEDITPGYLLDPESSYLANITNESSYLEKLSFTSNRVSEKSADIIHPNEDCPRMYSMVNDDPFRLFSLDKLNESTTGYLKLRNRNVVLYGDETCTNYGYSDITHDPIPFSRNPYLMKILSYVDIVLPDYSYNSAMVTSYADGNCEIPFHSDDEDDIEDGSDIVTISFGQARHMVFQEKSSSKLHYQLLQHGDVLIMSKDSQRDYRHAIPTEPMAMGLRISVTLRKLKTKAISNNHRLYSDVTSSFSSPERANTSSPIAPQHDGYQDSVYQGRPRDKRKNTVFREDKRNKPVPKKRVTGEGAAGNIKSHQPQKDTFFISSSMFRNLDTEKLSSDVYSAQKLFFPGKTASQMMDALKSDPTFKSLQHAKFEKVYVLTGTNNVDAAIKKPNGAASKAIADINNLLQFLLKSFPRAQVNVINILPRKSRERNAVISQLNTATEKFAERTTRLTYLDTYKNFMFSHSGGNRREEFFGKNAKFFDDVHLNFKGVVRLGKFLKFHMHHVN